MSPFGRNVAMLLFGGLTIVVVIIVASTIAAYIK